MEQELLTLPEHLSSPQVFSEIRVTRSLVLYVCFVDRRLSFCTFFFWPLCCLFFFDIRILIAPLVSSNSSCINFNNQVFFSCLIVYGRFCYSFINHIVHFIIIIVFVYLKYDSVFNSSFLQYITLS